MQGVKYQASDVSTVPNALQSSIEENRKPLSDWKLGAVVAIISAYY